MKIIEPYLSYFLRKIAKLPLEKGGHWLWLGSKDGKGYGKFCPSYRATPKEAHALSYEHFIGPLGKLHCLHKQSCGVKACVNPDHLYAGTELNNTRDRISNGQQFGVSLSTEQVAEIRKLLSYNTRQQAIADQFGIAQTTVSKIKRGIIRRFA